MCGCAENYHYLAHIIMPFSSDCWLPDGGRGFVSAFGVRHVSVHWEAHASKVWPRAGRRPQAHGTWLSPAPSPSELLRTGGSVRETRESTEKWAQEGRPVGVLEGRTSCGNKVLYNTRHQGLALYPHVPDFKFLVLKKKKVDFFFFLKFVANSVQALRRQRPKFLEFKG